MTDLQRNALAARIAQLPISLPHDSDEDEEQEEGDESDGLGALPTNLSARFPGTRSPSTSSSSSISKRRPVKPPSDIYSPISAESYFIQAVEIDVPSTGLSFRVYYSPANSPKGTVMVFHHGAGYSALSFSLLAKEIVETTGGECGVLALDARRHGKTHIMEDQMDTVTDENLDIQVLTSDFVEILLRIFEDPSQAPSLLLVGHSMGGSVVTRACPKLITQKFRIAGVVVLDVVEGSALEALPHMHNLLNSRPDGFGSMEAAIKWHVDNHTIRNLESARISVPALLIPSPAPASKLAYLWRTPLRSTAPYWTSWFKGLSAAFLSAQTARLLILAGTDRLDKELMIGQMQGKFQTNVVSNVGHMLHEDDPKGIAAILVKFWKRNERVIPGVKKVGER